MIQDNQDGIISAPQILYLGRWVDRKHFKVFVYNSTGEKLAQNYDEFIALISSGVWFAEKKDINAKILAENIHTFNEDDNVVPIKAKRGRRCQNQQQQ